MHTLIESELSRKKPWMHFHVSKTRAEHLSEYEACAAAKQSPHYSKWADELLPGTLIESNFSMEFSSVYRVHRRSGWPESDNRICVPAPTLAPGVRFLKQNKLTKSGRHAKGFECSSACLSREYASCETDAIVSV